MSDFAEKVKKATNYAEEQERNKPLYEQKCEQERIAREISMRAECTKRFCDNLKEYIAECARRGRYKLIGNTHIIKEIVTMPLYVTLPEYCGDTHWNFNNSLTSYENLTNSESLVNCLWKPKRYDTIPPSPIGWCSLFTPKCHYWRESLFGPLKSKWSVTYTLTPEAESDIACVKNMLEQENIQLTHLVVIKKYRDSDSESGFRDYRFYKSYKDSEIITSPKQFTVKKSMNETIDIYSVFECEYKYQ